MLLWERICQENLNLCNIEQATLDLIEKTQADLDTLDLDHDQGITEELDELTRETGDGDHGPADAEDNDNTSSEHVIQVEPSIERTETEADDTNT